MEILTANNANHPPTWPEDGIFYPQISQMAADVGEKSQKHRSFPRSSSATFTYMQRHFGQDLQDGDWMC